MKKSYHLCLSAGDEIMFRDLEDYRRGFNFLRRWNSFKWVGKSFTDN